MNIRPHGFEGVAAVFRGLASSVFVLARSGRTSRCVAVAGASRGSRRARHSERFWVGDGVFRQRRSARDGFGFRESVDPFQESAAGFRRCLRRRLSCFAEVGREGRAILLILVIIEFVRL